MRRFAAVVVASVIVLGLTACSSGGQPSSSKPVDATFKRLDGSTASFADYRGKPVLVNFFSSTCIPCVTEMPALERVHQELGSKVAFLGMNVQDTVAAAQSFLETVKVTWDIGRDPDGSILQRELGGVGLPTTALLDPQGIIVFKQLGVLDIGDLRRALADNHLA